MTARIVDVRQGVLSKNDALAAELRQRFRAAGVTVLNLVSSPGAGKTALLERTLADLLARGRRAAALVGDLATENDARRLARSGAPVRQIVTAGICHLEAEMVAAHLAGWDLAELDFLFIENVGNLVCPSSYDLGEDARVVLLSTTEGEDKPLNTHPCSTPPTWLLLPRSTWPRRSNSTAQRLMRRSTPYGRECRSWKPRHAPVKGSTPGWPG